MKVFKKKSMKKNEEKNVADAGEETANTETMNTEKGAEELPDAVFEEDSEVAKLELQLSEAKDKYIRLYSDFDNYKKRLSRERVDLIKSAGQDILQSFLPVIDDIERAMKAMNEAKDIESVKEGMQLVYQKLKAITESKGLKAMESVGKDFDPELHDAIVQLPSPSEEMKGKVVDEIEKGYYLNDKVIRHAKVAVGN